MKKIVLIGDSIFDNAPYVDAGDSVSEILRTKIDGDYEVLLLAVDGDVTTDVPKQLSSFPADATHTFVSCGGNDALKVADILNSKTNSVGESLHALSGIISEFRTNYFNMLTQILEYNKNLTVCTIYNKIPGMSESALTALALFNEVILQESATLGLPIIDLRVVCTDENDYSPVSPIEPSKFGGQKIVEKILEVISSDDYKNKHSTLYV